MPKRKKSKRNGLVALQALLDELDRPAPANVPPDCLGLYCFLSGVAIAEQRKVRCRDLAQQVGYFIIDKAQHRADIRRVLESRNAYPILGADEEEADADFDIHETN